MLRIDWQEGRLPTDFDDDYLELVHLLTEAAALEHALMIAYLYALFSIKDQYATVRGDVRVRSFLEHSPAGRGGTAVLRAHESFLDVAIEEMQHLSLVNRLLADLGASPNLTPHEFPYTSDLYPFDIELRSLTHYTAATYLWIEADDCALSLRPACRKTGEKLAFVRKVRDVIRTGSKRYHDYPVDEQQLSHVGSLYHRIVSLLQRVAQTPPSMLGPDFPWGDWEQRLNFVMFQGEESHYRFFRRVFTGEAFGGDDRIWRAGPNFPAHHFVRQTAFTARPHVIADEQARRVAWLSNLHYWIILSLLDLAYRARGVNPVYSAANLGFQYKAIDNMTMSLWSLGRFLADRFTVGVPFDALGPQYALGRDPQGSASLVMRLVQEAQRKAQALDTEGLMPADFNMAIYDLTLAGLEPLAASPPAMSNGRAEVFQGTERFSVVRLVGTGGMGVVYEVFDRERRQTVALKTLRKLDATSLYRFKHEFRALADIVHPNLIPLYELFADEQHWYFTMELVEHATDFLSYLRDGHPDSESSSETATHTIVNPSISVPVLAGESPGVSSPPIGAGPGAPVVDTDRLRRTLQQLAEGVVTLHEAGKLHRDLKPRNVLVRPDGRVVILDLGLVAELSQARHDRSPSDVSGAASDSSSSSGRSGPSEPRSYEGTDRKFAGTIAYMSPEQAARGPLTPASDWYAVGVMLFQALTGRLPFEGLAARVIREKQDVDPPRPRDLVPDLPDDLASLCEHLLRRDPAARPSGLEVLERLGVRPASAPWRVAGQTVDDLPFVGRTSHLDALSGAFESMLAGAPVVCRVHGRSGAGKSTLLARFLVDLADSRNAVVLTGRCYEQESVPFKAVDSLVDALTRYLMTLGQDELEAVTPAHTAALTRMFPVLARVETFARTVSASSSAGDPREMRRLAWSALRDLLKAIGARRPLVLYVDDVQWGDADSALLLGGLLQGDGAPRVLVLLAYRSEYVTTSPFLTTMTSETVSAARQVEVAVAPLAPDEALALARLLLRGERTDIEREAAWIARQSGGSALFVHELADHLNQGAATGGQATQLDAVLWERVQRLPDATRRLVEVVAVAARPVRLQDAQAAAHMPSLPADVIATLRTGRFVRTMRLDARHDEVEMFHDRIRESIVARLPGDVLRHHHAGLAVALELAGGADPETLAVHHEGSGDMASAGRYYARAAAEAAGVLAFGRAEALFRKAAATIADPSERAAVHERMIHFYTDMAHFAEAYDVGREATAHFGVQLPARFNPPLFALDFLTVRWRLRGRETARLVDLPLTSDARLETAVRLMTAVAKAAYQVRPELCVAVATRVVSLCLAHGNTRDCAIGYMVFGAIFQGGVLGNHRAGYEFGQLALALVEQYGNTQQRAEVHFVVGYFGTSWLRPSTDAEALWHTAFESGLETGDLFHTGCACAATTMSLHMRGVPFDKVWRQTERMVGVLERARLDEPLGVVRTVQQVMRNLRGETDAPGGLSDDGFDEAAFEASLAGFGSRHFAHCCYILRMELAYVRGDYAAAGRAARRADTYLKDSPGMLHAAEHHLYAALIELAQGRATRAVKRTTRRFARWAALCPHNFAHKSALLQGERARVRGHTTEALAAFDAARAAAQQYGYLQIEALADVLAARVHDAAGDVASRDAGRARADAAYARWGANALRGPSSR